MIYEDLEGKRVLVTGSSSGIGAETAVRFARQKAFVGVHYFRTEDGAKAAVAVETIAMAKEFAEYGVRVNSVIPGFIETRFHKKFNSPERVKQMPEKIPLGRNGKPGDIANAILFLASSEASGYITGEYIAVNGGIYMRT